MRERHPGEKLIKSHARHVAVAINALARWQTLEMVRNRREPVWIFHAKNRSVIKIRNV